MLQTECPATPNIHEVTKSECKFLRKCEVKILLKGILCTSEYVTVSMFIYCTDKFNSAK